MSKLTHLVLALCSFSTLFLSCAPSSTAKLPGGGKAIISPGETWMLSAKYESETYNTTFSVNPDGKIKDNFFIEGTLNAEGLQGWFEQEITNDYIDHVFIYLDRNSQLPDKFFLSSPSSEKILYCWGLISSDGKKYIGNTYIGPFNERSKKEDAIKSCSVERIN